jgi:hypothetical protein
MEKRYRSDQEGHISLYLQAEEAAIQTQKDRLCLFGDAKIHPIIQQSLDIC